MSISEQDKIGREEVVDKICGLVDSLEQDKNFCLALNGAWGSGKSFVLRLIEEKLSKKSEYVVIKYDAWENTFYSDPLIAILSCVIDGIEEKLYLVERTEEKVKKAVKTGVNTLAKLSTQIEKLKVIIEGIKTIIKDFHNPIDTAALGDFKSYQKLLKTTKEILNEITQAGEYREKQTKLVILVDEIDRCLPDEQIKILERLHHLFGVNNCAVIVALNQACVAKTVQTIYGIDGYEYLRKFFTFTFKLETSASEYLENLFRDYKIKLETIKNLPSNIQTSVDTAYQCLRYCDKKVLNNVDNREITRYFESINNVCNAFGWEKLDFNCVFFILIALYIRRTISSTFLNTDEIFTKQQERDAELNPLDYSETQMRYYDYLKTFLGMDRSEIPKEIFKFYPYGGCNISEYSHDFSEMVYYSVEYNFPYNSMRRFWGQPTVHPERCKKLRELIILYGGEQEKCER